MPDDTNWKDKMPTEQELNEAIDECQRQLKYLRSLLRCVRGLNLDEDE